MVGMMVEKLVEMRVLRLGEKSGRRMVEMLVGRLVVRKELK